MKFWVLEPLSLRIDVLFPLTSGQLDSIELSVDAEEMFMWEGFLIYELNYETQTEFLFGKLVLEFNDI